MCSRGTTPRKRDFPFSPGPKAAARSANIHDNSAPLRRDTARATMSSSLHRASEDHHGHATHDNDTPRPNESGTGVQPGQGTGAEPPKVEQAEPVNNPGKTPAPVAKMNDGASKTSTPITKTAPDTASATPAPAIRRTDSASRTPAPAAKTTDTAGKTQKTKETSAQKFVSLSKQGLAKAVGAAGGKTSAAKPALDESKETTDLRVVRRPDPKEFPVPRVDIIAVHDIDETLQRAWTYRKKPKRRANDSRAPVASGGIHSHDGEGGFGTTGSPAPGRHGSRRQLPATRKKGFDGSSNPIERWLAGAARPASAGEALPPDQSISEAPPDDYGPSNPIFAPVEEHDHHLSLLGMLTPVPEEEIPEHRPRVRRRPTLPNDRRKPAGHVADVTEEEKASSLGGRGGSHRHNADVLSDQRSSLDQGTERRVNWLTDGEMLPNEIPGARVMCYTYKSMKKVPSPRDYMIELAEDLVKRLAKLRPPEDDEDGKVPIVFVGLGFGCLIVQRTLGYYSQFDPTVSVTIMKRTAGVILLDAPAPMARYPRSRSQETNQTWTQDWLTTTNNRAKIHLDELWHLFRISTLGSITVSWHYSPTAQTNADQVHAPYTHRF